ncbi:MAG: 16S rRNA (guanine(527)-N(7))-methyltransferase RsmG [Treponemataceae bacterium]|nr:16S rRNA (guanine(527)-N(7))-methyltransferase RsmG [Treponemataceae bacterium]
MLKKGLEELGFSAEKIEEILPRLELYIKELQEFQKICHSALGAESYEEIVSKHILDSIAPYKILQNLIDEIKKANGPDYKIEIADVGSGNGCPGIPLAIVFPEYHFTLIERMTKRTAFLEKEVSVIQLDNVTVNTVEVERVAQQSFDIVVFRAFAPFAKKMIRPLLRILRQGGKLAAYKGQQKKTAEELAGVKEWAPEWEMLPVEVPYLTEFQRHIVVIPKAK